MERAAKCCHVCLAGEMVSNDWGLIQVLRSRHLVTLVDRVGLLLASSILKTADLLTLDCSGSEEITLTALPVLKKRFPGLRIVLVDGGLSQQQIAAAFQDGVNDYFSGPYEAQLLAERMDSLCGSPANRQRAPFDGDPAPEAE